MRTIHVNREALVTIRERSGMTQGHLAVAIGSSPGYLHDIESGRRHPSPKVMKQLAEALS